MFEKKALTDVPINDLLARRWSGVSYDPDRPVETEKLTSLYRGSKVVHVLLRRPALEFHHL